MAVHNAFSCDFINFFLGGGVILPIKTVVITNKIFKTKQLQDREGAIKPIHNETGLWNQQTVKDWPPAFEGTEAMLSHRLVSIAVSEVTQQSKDGAGQVPLALGTQTKVVLLLRLWAALWWCPLQHPYSQVQYTKRTEHLQKKFVHFVSLCFKPRVSALDGLRAAVVAHSSSRWKWFVSFRERSEQSSKLLCAIAC